MISETTRTCYSITNVFFVIGTVGTVLSAAVVVNFENFSKGKLF